jgi:putative transposase
MNGQEAHAEQVARNCVRILTVTDEHAGEALATRAARRLGVDDTVATLERSVQRRGTAPQLIRCDNGSELAPHV